MVDDLLLGYKLGAMVTLLFVVLEVYRNQEEWTNKNSDDYFHLGKPFRMWCMFLVMSALWPFLLIYFLYLVYMFFKKGTKMENASLGKCPKCGKKGVSRFKDDVRCVKGHIYPISEALHGTPDGYGKSVLEEPAIAAYKEHKTREAIADVTGESMEGPEVSAQNIPKDQVETNAKGFLDRSKKEKVEIAPSNVGNLDDILSGGKVEVVLDDKVDLQPKDKLVTTGFEYSGGDQEFVKEETPFLAEAVPIPTAREDKQELFSIVEVEVESGEPRINVSRACTALGKGYEAVEQDDANKSLVFQHRELPTVWMTFADRTHTPWSVDEASPQKIDTKSELAQPYEQKFASFIRMCQNQSDEGIEGIIITDPAQLGDTASEILESLNVLKTCRLALHLNK